MAKDDAGWANFMKAVKSFPEHLAADHDSLVQPDPVNTDLRIQVAVQEKEAKLLLILSSTIMKATVYLALIKELIDDIYDDDD
ncbi:hypothetical protein CHS0354_021034 [Potamilus streckersoni]|uniref:Uncharacterized protein n=1 Tax=Potamilus streckersoni TaxID=2493646 RepID=A0AAE0SDJ8_9BIVA|nr:hypothetical protein CHS0354_021034 [Potamilus streckersoni]